MIGASILFGEDYSAPVCFWVKWLSFQQVVLMVTKIFKCLYYGELHWCSLWLFHLHIFVNFDDSFCHSRCYSAVSQPLCSISFALLQAVPIKCTGFCCGLYSLMSFGFITFMKVIFHCFCEILKHLFWMLLYTIHSSFPLPLHVSATFHVFSAYFSYHAFFYFCININPYCWYQLTVLLNSFFFFY